MKSNIFKKFLTDNLFPPDFTCELCGIEIFSGRFCPDCAKTVALNDGKTCPVCGRKTAKNEICIECKSFLPAYDKAVSALIYRDGGAELIAKFKNGRAYLAGYFAELLREKLKDLPTFDCIVFVPMTKRAERKRGYNQSFMLAKKISQLSGVPVLKKAVKKVKETSAQKTLSRAQRLKNLSECYKTDKKLVAGKKVLVVDDVMTTGATLDAMTAKLKKAGAAKVFAACAASVEYSPSPNLVK